MKKIFKKIAFILVAVLVLQGIVPYNVSHINAAKQKKLKISANKIVLYIGQSKKLTVKGASKKVKWSSSKPKVASVSKSGKVKAKRLDKLLLQQNHLEKKLYVR